MQNLFKSLNPSVKHYAEGEVITTRSVRDNKILFIQSGAVFIEAGYVVSDSDKTIGIVKKAGSFVGLTNFILKEKTICKTQVSALHYAEVLSVSLADFNSAFDKLSGEMKLSVTADIGAQIARDYEQAQIRIEQCYLCNSYKMFKSSLKELASEIGEQMPSGVKIRVRISTLAKLNNISYELARRYRGQMAKASELATLGRHEILLLK